MKMLPRLHSSRAWAAFWPALVLFALVTAVAVVPAVPVLAQDDDAAAEGSADEGEAGAEEALGEASGEALPDIDEILEGDEEVLGGGGFTYDPGDRRDPFKSLLAAREADEPRGPRPEGIPGLLIDEVIISGIFRTPDGWLAQTQASANEKSHLIRVGDQLYDGDVIAISANEVVFKQIVQDPTALKPFREVVKKLNP
jgi:hypothetical protein